MAIGIVIAYFVALLIVLVWATTNSGTAATPPTVAPEHHCPPGSKPAGNGCIDRHPVTLTRNASPLRRAVRFYSARIHYWEQRMGAPRSHLRSRPSAYLAHVLRAKAYGLCAAYPRWHKRVWEHEYAWWKWLPDKFARVGACETGYGKKPGNWHWDSGAYVSAFGIIRAAFPTWNGHNTPREQYEVAAAIQRRFGWGAWGCGNA